MWRIKLYGVFCKCVKMYIGLYIFSVHSFATVLASVNCLLQMSSNSSLQVSHPLEKPSAACPADFRRGWRETFKVIPHRPLNKPFIHPASQCSHLCTVPLHPSMDTGSEASTGEEEGCLDFSMSSAFS